MVLHFTCHMLWSTGGPLYTVVSLGAKSRIVIIKVARRANTFPKPDCNWAGCILRASRH